MILHYFAVAPEISPFDSAVKVPESVLTAEARRISDARGADADCNFIKNCVMFFV